MKLAIALVLCSCWLLAACSDDGDGEPQQGSLCEQNCALNRCPRDSHSACLSQCANFFESCPAESEAAVKCRVAVPASQLVCDADAEVTIFKDASVCKVEVDALRVCLETN